MLASCDKIFRHLLSIKTFLLYFILFRHVLCNELRDKVSVSTMTVSDRAEPIHLQRTLLHLLFRCKCLSITCNFRYKDGVLVDLRRACTADVASNRVRAIVLDNEAALSRLLSLLDFFAPVLRHIVAMHRSWIHLR